ncbi:7-cyano-7-deazaguanine synthase [Singulisphaera sp. Ch08]|uniref:7-cyano-7-deazaguanine synthase n=1 Tax=Singulisphaera sp. Ch08 TaxID=3120278 RepID=A0AAU7CR23_9BACT
MSDIAAIPEVAVLVSGGLESAILCVDLLRQFRRVHPLYVRFGLRWEEVELAWLRRYLQAVERPGLCPLELLDEPVANVYGRHWSVEGLAVPDASSPDEAVYLPGRNLLFISKAAVWCRLRNVERLALGCLGTNPFPDSTPTFFDQMEAAVNQAMEGRLRILRPFDRMHKDEVLKRGRDLPLQFTFSCLSPVDGQHCGRCNKCAERRHGFRDAHVPDPTNYAAIPPDGSLGMAAGSHL